MDFLSLSFCWWTRMHTLFPSLSFCWSLKDKQSAMQGVWSQWFRSSSLKSVGVSEACTGLHWLTARRTSTFGWFKCVWLEPYMYAHTLWWLGVSSCRGLWLPPTPHPLVWVISPLLKVRGGLLPGPLLLSHAWAAPGCVMSQCEVSPSADSLTCFCITWHYRQHVRQPPPQLSQRRVVVVPSNFPSAARRGW